MGLFDTVASYGANFNNDTYELHLNFGNGYANKVVHLVALDEFRMNFSLTNIKSAVRLSSRNGKGQMGYELRIPGAHSDVGGGYLSWTEKRDLTPDQQGSRYQEFIYRKGWYVASQNQGMGLHVRKINPQFHKVALGIMLDKIRAYAKINIPQSIAQVSGKDDVSTTIRNIQGILRQWAKDESHTIWDLDGNSDQNWAKWVRNTTLHLSSSYDGASDTIAYRPATEWVGNSIKRTEHDG